MKALLPWKVLTRRATIASPSPLGWDPLAQGIAHPKSGSPGVDTKPLISTSVPATMTQDESTTAGDYPFHNSLWLTCGPLSRLQAENFPAQQNRATNDDDCNRDVAEDLGVHPPYCQGGQPKAYQQAGNHHADICYGVPVHHSGLGV